MSDLDDAFRALRADVLARVRPSGLADARARSRRRRQRQAVAVAVLALLAVVLPIAAYAAAPHHAAPGDGPTRSPRPSHSGRSAGPPRSGPSYAGTRTNRGPGGFCPAALYPAPAGGLTREQVCDGTIEVPPWPAYLDGRCGSGPLTFSDGVHFTGVHAVTFGPPYGAWYTPIYYTDVDHDGAVDTVLVINCDTVASEVVVLKPAPGGGIATFGLVATGDEIDEIAVTGPGDIQVDYRGWRTYAWEGGRFVEVTGVPAPSGSALPPGSPPPVSGSPMSRPSPAPTRSSVPVGAPISPSSSG